MPALPHPAANRLVQSAFLIGFAMRKALSIVLPTRHNSLIHNEIRQFSGICRLSCRHAVRYCESRRYIVFSGYDGYPTDTRNANSSIVLWQMRSSDYPADTRKSNVCKHLWPKRILDGPGRACARGLVAGWKTITVLGDSIRSPRAVGPTGIWLQIGTVPGLDEIDAQDMGCGR
jgi:hypothetical protein